MMHSYVRVTVPQSRRLCVFIGNQSMRPVIARGSCSSCDQYKENPQNADISTISTNGGNIHEIRMNASRHLNPKLEINTNPFPIQIHFQCGDPALRCIYLYCSAHIYIYIYIYIHIFIYSYIYTNDTSRKRGSAVPPHVLAPSYRIRTRR